MLLTPGASHMTVASTAVNLATYAQMSNNPLVMAVTSSLIDYGNVIVDIPLVTNPSLIATGARWEGNLPIVTWRPLNSEGQTTQGTPTPWQEQVYILTNYIDTDKYIVLDKNAIGNPRSNQVNVYLKAQTYDFNYKFFKNDHVTGDTNAMVGIRYRIDNGGIYGVRPENKIDCGGSTADISQASITAKTAGAFLEMLDLLLWSVDSDNGSNVILYMNDYMKRRLDFVLRYMGTSGGLNVSQDQFDRTITQYKGAMIKDPGVKADQSTRILAGNAIPAGSGSVGETAAGVDSTGSSANFTSIYAVNYSEDHFGGWQFDEINVQDLGLINNGVIYRTLIDWAVGFKNDSTRSLGRLYDIKIG
jgi:hypothetical protein